MSVFINICQTLGVIGLIMCLICTAVDDCEIKAPDWMEAFAFTAIVFLFGGFGLAFIGWFWT